MLLTTGAPLVFDIVGGSLVVLLVLVLSSGKAPLIRPLNPRIENYERLCGAFAGLAVGAYIVYFFAFWFGGYQPLIAFLTSNLDDEHHTWTVWLCLGLWVAITAPSLLTLEGHWGEPLGDPRAMPVVRYGFWFFIWCALLLYAEIPVPARHDLVWELVIGVNFAWHCGLVFNAAECFAGLVLRALVPRWNARAMIEEQTASRNAPIFPRARGNLARWWSKFK